MIERGKTYDVDLVSRTGLLRRCGLEAIRVEMPLVLFRDPSGAEAIINTASPFFASARESGDPGQRVVFADGWSAQALTTDEINAIVGLLD